RRRFVGLLSSRREPQDQASHSWVQPRSRRLEEAGPTLRLKIGGLKSYQSFSNSFPVNKFETRNPKFETNPNAQKKQKIPNRVLRISVLDFAGFGSFL
ncbi:MAG TPA: hypothetical protein VLD83_15930, partial [Candidatus Binatia bacterium]|nr:hypothetical protein [Candidatus Binatia bacterium]